MAKKKNDNLHQAKKEKNDEFYTQLEDIEKELACYDVSNFNDKVIYCNCDDYRVSNFCKCFKDNFEYLGIKKVICTNYDNGNGAWKYEYDGKNETVTELEGNGGFETAECVEFLKEADVVVTNPPFSLFRAYVKQLMDYGKKFLIIGEQNALTYKEIFPYIKANKLWWGKSIHSGDRKFYVPDDYEMNAATCGIDKNGKKFIRVKGIRWWTNIVESVNTIPLDLYKKYNPEEYPKFDYYDVIEVSKTCEIPMDYDGVMGVPISFLDKYCPKQFEIVDAREYGLNDRQRNKSTMLIKDADSAINGKPTYARIAIKRIS